MKVTTETAVAAPVEGPDFFKVMGEIERSKYIIAATRHSMGEWRRLEEARFVLQKNGIGYNTAEVDRMMAELKREVVAQYKSAVKHF